jgi:hypothetical protein
VGHLCFVAKQRDLRQLATIELMTRKLPSGNIFLSVCCSASSWSVDVVG